MDPEKSVRSAVHLLAPYLEAKSNDGSIVVMMCGVSGAGKSTLSYAVTEAYPSFTCLSIDAIIAHRHGIYNIDYPASEYEARSKDAREEISKKLDQLLEKKKNIVLDRSFYARSHRDEFRVLVERAGGRVVLVYLKAERDLLWKRICERRNKGVNAHSAREISPALLDQFVRGFEAPEREGQIVIVVE